MTVHPLGKLWEVSNPTREAVGSLESRPGSYGKSPAAKQSNTVPRCSAVGLRESSCTALALNKHSFSKERKNSIYTFIECSGLRQTATNLQTPTNLGAQSRERLSQSLANEEGNHPLCCVSVSSSLDNSTPKDQPSLYGNGWAWVGVSVRGGAGPDCVCWCSVHVFASEPLVKSLQKDGSLGEINDALEELAPQQLLWPSRVLMSNDVASFGLLPYTGLLLSNRWS